MMKKITSFLRNTITWGCVTFTALTAVIYTVAHFTNNTDYVTTPRMLGLMIFSMIVGAASAFLFTDLMNFPVRLVIHYGLCLGSFLLCFVVWNSYVKTDRGNMILVMFFTVCYAVVTGVTFGIRAIVNRKKKEEKEEEYKPKFSR